MITEYKVKLPAESSLKDYIKFFKAIPANEWCINVLQDDTGKRCANGHVNAFYTGDGNKWPDNLWIDKHAIICYAPFIISSNNGNGVRFLGSNRAKGIKTRVLSYLKNILSPK
jgi:hypothetical protein